MPSSSSLNHLSSWPPPIPHYSFSSSSTAAGPPLHSHWHPQPPSSVSSTTTRNDTLPIQARTPKPLTSPQKAFLQIQLHLDKARYRGETNLSPCPAPSPHLPSLSPSLYLPSPVFASFLLFPYFTYQLLRSIYPLLTLSYTLYTQPLLSYFTSWTLHHLSLIYVNGGKTIFVSLNHKAVSLLFLISFIHW